MEKSKKEFIEFLLENGALRLNNPDDPEGLFTLKSGRRSPYFMNLGEINKGVALAKLGHEYAKVAHEAFGDDIDVFFGPAYKGIPLAVVTADNYSWEYHLAGGGKINEHAFNARYSSNRKEAKDHGDAGIMLGSKLHDGDKVVIIEDVVTSGKSMEEVVPIIRAQADVNLAGLIVAFDRHEYGKDDSKTALDEIAETYGFETHAIARFFDVYKYIEEMIDGMAENILGLSKEELGKKLEQFDRYFEMYGPKVR